VIRDAREDRSSQFAGRLGREIDTAFSTRIERRPMRSVSGALWRAPDRVGNHVIPVTTDE
jgi:hypothetical protein